MMPYYHDTSCTIYHGDARKVLTELPEESIQCVVTSPPYWGLRDYGLTPLEWGSPQSDLCEGGEHKWVDATYVIRSNDNKGNAGTEKQYTNIGTIGRDQPRKNAFCHRCGAWKGSLGLEPTPELYIQHLVEIFRQVKRVLRRDGTLWLNLGDSYASGKGSCFNPGGGENSLEGHARLKEEGAYIKNRSNISDLEMMGLKPKDLCMIPARVALALQSDGWWLRSDIIWSKPNPMPESVQDRPTRSHEYLFLLTKAAKYFYDAEAIREPGAYCERGVGWRGTDNKHTAIECSVPDANGKKSKRIRYMTSGKHSKTDPQAPGHRIVDNVKTARALGALHDFPFGTFRNRRSVWTIATQPYKDAHFATFPEKLVEPCILAGASERGCCPKCGAPWERVVEKTGHINKREAAHQPNNTPSKTDSTGWAPTKRATDYWQPTCKCGRKDTIPCIVLDPFGGSGVTGVVAKKLGRRAILIDLKREYCDMAIKRLPKQERLSLSHKVPAEVLKGGRS